MTTIYKRQRELVELASKYAHAINDGLIGAGEIMPADGHYDSPMDAERADYATSRAWKSRWYEIEGIRTERMREIYLSHRDRQEANQ